MTSAATTRPMITVFSGYEMYGAAMLSVHFQATTPKMMSAYRMPTMTDDA
jgi:hypothetical protein